MFTCIFVDSRSFNISIKTYLFKGVNTPIKLNARAFIVLGKPVIHTAWATMNGFMPIYGVIAIVQRHQKMHSCLNCLIVDVQAGNCRSDCV